MVQDKLEGGHATRQCYMYKTTAERHVTKQKIEAAMSGTKVFFGSEAWTASAAVVPPPRSHAAPRRAFSSSLVATSSSVSLLASTSTQLPAMPARPDTLALQLSCPISPQQFELQESTGLLFNQLVRLNLCELKYL